MSKLWHKIYKKAILYLKKMMESVDVSGTIAIMSVIFKRTKILATLGPATNTPEMIEKLLLEGVNGIRLNFSHGTHEERDEQLPWIRQASKKVGKPVAILQDLQGPKIRLGALADNRWVKGLAVVT